MSNIDKAKITLDFETLQILTGMLLGDAWLSKTGVYWRFCVEQKDHDFVLDLWNILNDLKIAGSKPFLRERREQKFTSWSFQTISLPIFSTLHDEWYKAIGPNRYIKILPQNIMLLFTPLTIAYWICGDGSYNKKSKAMFIYTNNFSKSEVEKLAFLFLKMYDIKCTVLKKDKNGPNPNNYFIRIGRVQAEKLILLIVPHMHKSYLYRVGL
jgi:hypothetical protein